MSKHYRWLVLGGSMALVCALLLLRPGTQPPPQSALPPFVVYTTLPALPLQALLEEETQKRGLQLHVVSLPAEELPQRLQREEAQPQASLVLADRPTLLRLKQVKALRPVLSEQVDLVPDELKDDDETWVGLWYDPFVFAVNSEAVKNWKKVPGSWEDLLRYKELRLTMTDFLAADAPAELLTQLLAVQGEQGGMDYLRRLHPQVVRYAKFLSTPVRMAGMGEADVAVVLYSEAERYVREQFPLQIIWPQTGTAYLLTGGCLPVAGPREAEAEQLLDWLLSAACVQKREASMWLALPTNPAAKKMPRPELWQQEERPLAPAKRRKLLENWLHTIRLGLKPAETMQPRMEEQQP